MAPQEWPDGPDEKVDPALAPLQEAGQGESEGFELAEQDLIEHASHGDQHGTSRITSDAAGFDDPEEIGAVDGEADEEGNPDA
jgi:hypothetical protein